MDAKQFREARKLVNNILKKLNRNDLDWTIQTSISSIESREITYACQIQSPNEVLQPIIFLKKSWKELKNALIDYEKTMNNTLVMISYHTAEVARSEEKKAFHEESIAKLQKQLEKELEK